MSTYISKRLIRATLFLLITSILSGCGGKTPQTGVAPQDTEESVDFAPRKTKIRPIVGSRANDSRMIRDFGYVQKIWIAPYKTGNDALIASHDSYVVIKKPDWVVGEDLPKNNKRGLEALKAPTFQSAVSPDEIENADATTDNIMKFVDHMQKIDKSPERVMEKMDSKDYDSYIEKYLDAQKN